VKDEGWHSGIVGFRQEQIPNHSKLRVKSRGGEHWGKKRGLNLVQVSVRETNESDLGKLASKESKCRQNQERVAFCDKSVGC